jgi:hypothetical protein
VNLNVDTNMVSVTNTENWGDDYQYWDFTKPIEFPLAVLRIRDVYPGSWVKKIPDLDPQQRV